MNNYSTRRRQNHRSGTSRTRFHSWCCSFSVPPPSSPETISKSKQHQQHLPNSFPNSPSTTKSSLMGRIKSPGRVSPLEDHLPAPTLPSPSSSSLLQQPERTPTRMNITLPPFEEKRDPPEPLHRNNSNSTIIICSSEVVRLNLRGRNAGGSLVLELDSRVLSANSATFAELIVEREEEEGSVCRIEVGDVENLGVFRDTVELMFVEEEDVLRRLVKAGVYRSIDVLEVSVGIRFSKGIHCCLKYLEAVPWNEEEEEKLRSLFTRFTFDDAVTKDILARLFPGDSVDSEENLPRQLLWSVTTCTNATARNELKSLVKGLLGKSSVYEKDLYDPTKEEIYDVCESCLISLISLFKEATDTESREKSSEKANGKTLIERISTEVDNINWLLEIMLDRQVAEEFVYVWASQKDLLMLHENTTPMIRYELSRVSANLFSALGTRKLHCRSEYRSGLLQAWFIPMLLDFGWLQRCKKGLDMKALEGALGQSLLTLPLKQQHTLFMEWFRYFSKHGKECPDLNRAFQIWWRRSFLRGSNAHAIEAA